MSAKQPAYLDLVYSVWILGTNLLLLFKKIREEELSKLPKLVSLEETTHVVFKRLEILTLVSNTKNTKMAVIIRIPQTTLEIYDGVS